MENKDQVAVIIYDRHGMIDEIFLDTMENAKKRRIIHNLGYFLNSDSSEEDENMDECEFSRPAHWHKFNKTPDMKNLWVYRKFFE